MTTVQLLIVSEGNVSVELLWNVQPHFQPHFFGAQHFSHCLNTPLRGFFKRVENKLLPRVKQSPWARRRWDWRNSERWCQAHRDFKKYKLQQIWICTVFFSFFLYWTHITRCTCVWGCYLILPSDLCVLQSSLFVGQNSWFTEVLEDTREAQIYSRCSVVLALFTFHVCLTLCSASDVFDHRITSFTATEITLHKRIRIIPPFF